jgi:hypothetical protein
VENDFLVDVIFLFRDLERLQDPVHTRDIVEDGVETGVIHIVG